MDVEALDPLRVVCQGWSEEVV